MSDNSPKRTSLKVTPFTKEQVTWVIFKYGERKNVMAVKKAFNTHFFKHQTRKVPNYNAFKRLIARFESTGGRTRGKAVPGREQVPQQDSSQSVLQGQQDGPLE